MGWVREWGGTTVTDQPRPIVIVRVKELKPVKEFKVTEWRK